MFRLSLTEEYLKVIEFPSIPHYLFTTANVGGGGAGKVNKNKGNLIIQGQD